MAELKRTYIKGNLSLIQFKYKEKDKDGKEIEKKVNPSFKIGVNPKNANDASVSNHNAHHWDSVNTKGTGLVERCQDVASKVLGRSQKLNLNFWSGGYLVIDGKGSPWKMTKDKNKKNNFSVKLVGDSLRIYGKLKYDPKKDDAQVLDGNFVNKLLIRVKLQNKSHFIKRVGKATGTCAGCGPACSIYVTDARESRALIRSGKKEGGKWVWNSPIKNKIYAPKTADGKSFYTSIRPVKDKNPTDLTPPAAGKEWPIWFDIMLSATTSEIKAGKTLSFYIECPVVLNNIYTDFGGNN